MIRCFRYGFKIIKILIIYFFEPISFANVPYII
jgi:hypothetical protein